MKQKYFTINDDFNSIIKEHIKDIKSITRVTTGWTNFVFKVNDGKNIFYFRFPNNDHFSWSIVKEYNFNKYIKNKIKFKIPQLELYYDNSIRPYTKHLEIEGESLTDCYNNLTKNEKQELCKDIIELCKQFHNINYKNEQNFSFEKLSDYLIKLTTVYSKDCYNQNIEILKTLEEKEMVISHGDLNPGNLILKNHKLVAIIDFAFSGISSEYSDISRLIGRLPNDFKPMLINEYEKSFKTKINQSHLDKLINTWKNIEEDYTEYIKNNHTYISLPK